MIIPIVVFVLVVWYFTKRWIIKMVSKIEFKWW